MKWQAVDHWILALKDEVVKEKNGFVLPPQSQNKPTTGKILSVGGCVEDKKIQDGMAGMFIAGSGFTLEVDGQELLVLNDKQIIAVK